MNRQTFRKSLIFFLLFAFVVSMNGGGSVVSGSSNPAAAMREPARGRHAMVASQHELASRIGVDILKKGGNAVDAAIAVGIALAVVYPEAGNLGGGGFMLIRRSDGQAVGIDYREMAPGAATRDMYVDKDG